MIKITLLLLLLPQLAFAVPLTVRCTAPAMNNLVLSCETPSLIAASPLDSLWVIAMLSAPSPLDAYNRRDSLWRAPGDTISFNYDLPTGNYYIRAQGGRKRADGSMKRGCDTTIVKSVTATEVRLPWKPRFR